MMQASAYCAAKNALTGMVKCVSQEYKRHGIRFSLMHFGGVDSSFLGQYRDEGSARKIAFGRCGCP